MIWASLWHRTKHCLVFFKAWLISETRPSLLGTQFLPEGHRAHVPLNLYSSPLPSLKLYCWSNNIFLKMLDHASSVAFTQEENVLLTLPELLLKTIWRNTWGQHMIQKWSAFQFLCCCGHTGLKRPVWQADLTSLLIYDASCSVTSLLTNLRSNKKPPTYLSFPKDPWQWHSFTSLLACSGLLRPHAGLICWEICWLPARLCTHWSFLRSRMEEGSSAMPGFPATVVPMGPWLGTGPQTVKQRLSFLPCFFFSWHRNSNESNFACEVSD